MPKPVPYVETKKIMDLMEMQHWIDEKYGIKARDYARRHTFVHSKEYVKRGISEERAKYMSATAPAKLLDELTLEELAIRKEVQEEYTAHMAATPNQDFWHFQLEMFDNFSNDSYQRINLLWQLEACKEDWQKEIAQMWLDEYGEFMDEEGDIELWVSW